MEKKKSATILTSGLCECIREPWDGEKGLEGYNLGESYRYQEMCYRKRRYYRIYPEGEDGASPDYYEVCGPDIFLRFFRSISSKNVSDPSGELT